MQNKIKNKKGFGLIEIIIYIAIFTAISILVINSFIVILSSFNTTNMNRKLLESSSTVMERVSREIRKAKNIDIANSTLGSTPGVLQLNTTDGAGNNATIKFIVASQTLNLYRNNNLIGNLLNQDVSITNLVFRRIQTANGEAVKVEMTLRYSSGHNTKSENFYDTIVLRGGY